LGTSHWRELQRTAEVNHRHSGPGRDRLNVWCRFGPLDNPIRRIDKRGDTHAAGSVMLGGNPERNIRFISCANGFQIVAKQHTALRAGCQRGSAGMVVAQNNHLVGAGEP